MSTIAVLGAGSWGTALAIVLARNGHDVKLWGRDLSQLELMKKSRCNQRYLEEIILPDRIQIVFDLREALEGIQDILLVVPSEGFRSILEDIKDKIRGDARIAWATKGLDPGTGLFLHQLAEQILGKQHPFAILAGPSFAREVALGLPTAVTIAGLDRTFTNDLLNYFHSATFRVYLSEDLIGVEVGSVVKNVLAVATGIADGLGLGANTRAALITRGLAEMMRLGLTLGGKRETFMGLAGLGDLVLTCTDNQSRNRRFGLALGAGRTSIQAQEAIGQVIEALANTGEVFDLAQKSGIEMPIVEQVYRVLRRESTPREAVQALMKREPKSE